MISSCSGSFVSSSEGFIWPNSKSSLAFLELACDAAPESLVYGGIPPFGTRASCEVSVVVCELMAQIGRGDRRTAIILHGNHPGTPEGSAVQVLGRWRCACKLRLPGCYKVTGVLRVIIIGRAGGAVLACGDGRAVKAYESKKKPPKNQNNN